MNKEPKFHKARSVPYALKAKVETALLKMERAGVIDRVASAPCAAPIILVQLAKRILSKCIFVEISA